MLLLLLLTMLYACGGGREATGTSDASRASDASPSGKTPPPAAINLDYMDRSVDPGVDFFRYVNGRWLDSTEIPADRERWGSFDELRQTTDKQTLQVLQNARQSGKYAANTDQGKAAAYFALALDTVRRAQQGIEPIRPHLEEIATISSYEEVVAYERRVLPKGMNSLLGFGIGTNPKNSNVKVVNLTGGALGLPDRDYYPRQRQR